MTNCDGIPGKHSDGIPLDTLVRVRSPGTFFLNKKGLSEVVEGFGIMKRVNGIMKRVDGIMKKVDGIMKKVDGITKSAEGIMKKFDGIKKKVDGIMKRV